MKQLLLFLLMLLVKPCVAQVSVPGEGGSEALPYSCTEPVSRQQHYADSLLLMLVAAVH